MPKEPPKKVKTSIQVGPLTLRRMKRFARAERRTVSSLVEMLVEQQYQAAIKSTEPTRPANATPAK